MAGSPRLIASCPSCGTDMSAVPKDHVLTIEGGRRHENDVPARPVACCNYGDPVDATALMAAIRG